MKILFVERNLGIIAEINEWLNICNIAVDFSVSSGRMHVNPITYEPYITENTWKFDNEEDKVLFLLKWGHVDV